jgi:hypothetical protein
MAEISKCPELYVNLCTLYQTTSFIAAETTNSEHNARIAKQSPGRGEGLRILMYQNGNRTRTIIKATYQTENPKVSLIKMCIQCVNIEQNEDVRWKI